MQVLVVDCLEQEALSVGLLSSGDVLAGAEWSGT
jgi:hypothetical protein